MTVAPGLRRIADRAPQTTRSMVDDAATAARVAIERAVDADTGGDGRLSNLRGGSISIDVKVSGDRATVAGRGGALTILEAGTKTRRTRPDRIYLTPGGPRWGGWTAGRSPPKRTWTTGVAQAARPLVAAADKAWKTGVA